MDFKIPALIMLSLLFFPDAHANRISFSFSANVGVLAVSPSGLSLGESTVTRETFQQWLGARVSTEVLEIPDKIIPDVAWKNLSAERTEEGDYEVQVQPIKPGPYWLVVEDLDKDGKVLGRFELGRDISRTEYHTFILKYPSPGSTNQPKLELKKYPSDLYTSIYHEVKEKTDKGWRYHQSVKSGIFVVLPNEIQYPIESQRPDQGLPIKCSCPEGICGEGEIRATTPTREEMALIASNKLEEIIKRRAIRFSPGAFYTHESRNRTWKCGEVLTGRATVSEKLFLWCLSSRHLINGNSKLIEAFWYESDSEASLKLQELIKRGKDAEVHSFVQNTKMWATDLKKFRFKAVFEQVLDNSYALGEAE